MKPHLALIPMALCACTASETDFNHLNVNSQNTHVIKVSTNYGDIFSTDIDDLFYDFKYVCLETTEKSIVGVIDKIEIHNDTIYVLDRSKAKSLQAFDMNGRHIATIGRQGNGPFEFSSLTDFSVGNGNIVILDNVAHKLIEFDHNGREISESRLPFKATGVASLNDGIYAFSGACLQNVSTPEITDYSLWTWDSTSEHILGRAVRHENNKYANLISLKCLRNFNGETYFCDMIANDTIYHVNHDGSLDAVFAFDFADKRDLDLLRDTPSSDYVENLKLGKFMHVCDYAITENNVFYSLTTKGMNTNIFHNVRTEEERKATMCSHTPKIHPGGDCTTILAAHEGSLVWAANATDFTSIAQRAQKSEKYWDDVDPETANFNKRLTASISEEDNPVLVFARPKE